MCWLPSAVRSTPAPPRPTAPLVPWKRCWTRELNDASPGRALVHGCGAVGGTVARHLVEHGWTVFTVDLDRERAGFPVPRPSAGMSLVGAEAGPAAALLDLGIDHAEMAACPAGPKPSCLRPMLPFQQPQLADDLRRAAFVCCRTPW